MDNKKIKTPMTQEEYEAFLDTFSEVSDDELDTVVGGNDDMKAKLDNAVIVTCPFCSADVNVKTAQDMPKHMKKCPNNPYK